MDANGTSPVRPSALTEAERDRIHGRARQLRAEAARDIGRAIAGAVRRWVGARRAARRRARAVAELRGLDARMLKDIGLAPGGIVAAVHGLDAADPAPLAVPADTGNVVAFDDRPRRRPAKRPAPTFRARENRRRAAAGG